jgi:thiol-disulfide isomerase/thioredoxin
MNFKIRLILGINSNLRTMKSHQKTNMMRLPGYFTRSSSVVMMLVTAVLLSCNPNRGKKATTPGDQDTSAVGFKPNPQKIEERHVQTMKIGDKAVDFNLPDVSGRFYQLDDFKESSVMVIIFTCNHCPTAQAYEDRIIQFTSDYRDKGVSVVAIMPNSAYSLLLEECGYSDLDDTYESMIIRAKEKNFNFPYLYDGDNEAVSIQYGPTATPHAFVFNKNRELCYVGRLDASEKPGTGNAGDLRAAVDAILSGKPVETPENKSFGCSVKWAWKTEWTEKVNNDWNNRPVTLEKISKAAIADLLANKSEKIRLINVWATWCGPCVIEYPELVKLQRMYGDRKFEFISLSADKPDDPEKVLDFLKSRYSAVKNYVFDQDDKYALIEAVDPAWNGALPYTMLVEPGGRIIYSVQGAVDLLELKQKIVEHPLIGRYY